MTWTPTSIKKYFTEYPELMGEHFWVFQVERVQDYNPGAPVKKTGWELAKTLEDPKGYVPVLPVRTADYKRDPVVNLLLLLWRMIAPLYNVHIGITTLDDLRAANLKYYVYTEFPPLVDLLCPLCGQIGRASVGEELLVCDCGYNKEKE